MKKKSLLTFVSLAALCVMMVFTLALIGGCKGSDGAAGAQGPQGEPGPVTLTNASCAVCHGSGQAFDVNSNNANSVHYNSGQDADTFLTISSIVVSNVSDTLEVSFHVADSSGNAFALVQEADLRIMIADLVPADTVPIQGNISGVNYQSGYFKRWVSQTSSNFQGFDDSDASNGNYTVTLAANTLTIDPAAYGNSYIDLTSHIQRVAVNIAGDTVSTGGHSSVTYITANAVGVHDITGIPAAGSDSSADTTLQYNSAYVTIQACEKCHGDQMQGAAHASSYLDTRECVFCHSPLYRASIETDKAIFTQWAHEIHAAKQQFSEVEFPQPFDNCVVCHQDPDNLTAGSAAQIDNWMNHPTATACTSCHNDVNPLTIDVQGIVSGVATTLTAGQNHPYQVAANSCGSCHGHAGTVPSNTDIVTVHKLPEFVNGNDTTSLRSMGTATAAMNTPEFDATITITEPTGSAPAGGFFVAGDTPLVTVTLKNHSDGSAVASSVYTTLSTDPSSAKGVAGGGLNSATVYVYGPRSVPGPVLTLNAASDRGESVLLPSTDPNVKTDSSGYKYLMQAIPATMTAGTYVVGIQFMDYNAVSATDYKTASVAKALFQVGTATVTPNVAGDGSCINCHGDTRMHLTGSHAHNVPFDTDYCNMCHDTTGLHGNPIANRVHAVHSGNSTGDLGSHASYDWSGVKFPQNVSNCVSCHISGSTGYLTGFEPVACFGCHGKGVAVDNNATWDHMLQNGANVIDQKPNFK